MLTLGPLNAMDGIRHGFFTREGGVSRGLFASLNCGFGSGDAPDAITTNRGRAMDRLEVKRESLTTVHQVHSPIVVEIDAPVARERAPKADAMVTRTPSVALGILTADCAPVLFAEGEARVVGAAHAGWRGALTGVLDATVTAMVKHGARPERIIAAIGPCIAQRSYEVGPEFPAPFLAADPADAIFFAPSTRTGHFMFDLRGYVARRLGKTGITQIYQLPNDTCHEEARFFSYRRACLRGEGDYGRGLSAIVLEG